MYFLTTSCIDYRDQKEYNYKYLQFRRKILVKTLEDEVPLVSKIYWNNSISPFSSPTATTLSEFTAAPDTE